MSNFGGRRSDGGGGSTWMSGLISGAGKVISSVFGSDDTQSSSSSSTYSYSDSDSDSAEEENTDVSSKGMGEEKQIEEKPEPAKDYNGRSLAIISEIESKRAIEQLIKAETFSSEEFYHLTKIIQSRVIGEDGIHKELFDRFPGNATAFPGAWKSSNQAKEVPETISFSPTSLDALSPRFSAARVLTPDLHHSVVKEAKKWLDDKRLASSSDLDIRYEPCSLNACLPRYDVEGRVGSPVDMAKSYMRSLPPWKSLPSCNSGFEKTPPIATHLYKEISPYATANHSSSSSKSLKRNYFDLGLKDTFDEIRKVRRKAAENMSDNPRFKIIDLSAAYSEREACQTSSTDQKCIFRDSRYLSASESREAPENLSLELPAKHIHSIGALALPNETVEVSNPVRVGSIISVNLIPDAEETVNAVETTLATSFHTTLPLRANSTIGSGFQLCAPPALVSNETQDAQQLSKVKERVDSLSVPHNSPSLAPTLVQHEGVNVENFPSSTSQQMVAVNIKSAPSAEAVTSLNDVNTSSRKTSSLSQKLVSSVEEVQTITDSKQDGNVKIEVEPNGFRNSNNGSTAGSDADLHVAASRHNPSNIEHVVDISKGTSDDSTDFDIKSPLGRTSSSRGRPRAGPRKKSVKDELTETQATTSLARGRKTVPRPRRGRGK